jgi:hypothetical protein
MKAADPESGLLTDLFNPRTQIWTEHFQLQQFLIEPLSSCGAATTAALELNHPRRVQIRRAESLFGLFPP